MLEMFKGMVNSPETTITNDINAEDTIIYVLDETKVPEELPNLMVLGTGVSAETIKVISIDGNALTVERGFQGVPRSWNTGTVIARNFTEYDYNALKENIETLKENTDTNADDILDLMSYVGDLENLDTVEKSNIVLALNETYQDLAAHKVESATDDVHGILERYKGFRILKEGCNVGVVVDVTLPDNSRPYLYVTGFGGSSMYLIRATTTPSIFITPILEHSSITITTNGLRLQVEHTHTISYSLIML